MRMLTTIVSLCAGLLAFAPISALGQQSVDLSQARELTLVWKTTFAGGGTKAMSFLPNFGGRQGFDVLTTAIARERGNVIWATRPKLDTTTLFNWLGINNALHVRELDYDGIPPLEYINSLGVVWRCASKDQPLPLVPIDTIEFDRCIDNPLFSADVDSDGFLDVVTVLARNNKTTSIVMGGPQSGKGCARVFPIDLFGGRNVRNTRAFFRSVTGKWRVVQHEYDNDDVSSWMVIYDMDIFRQDGRVQFRAVKRDSLRGVGTSVDDDPLGFSTSVADTVAKKDWLVMFRRLESTGPWVLERFDITDGHFLSVEQVGGISFDDVDSDLGYSLGTDRPVIRVGILFFYADNLRQPFARWKAPGIELSPISGMTAINDQTGDGRPDLVMTGGDPENGVMALYTLDPAVSVSDDPQPSTAVPVRMMGDVLEVSLTMPAWVSVTIAGIEGRESSLLAPQHYPAGVSSMDLAPLLRSYPRGAYYLRVRTGDALHTINLIR